MLQQLPEDLVELVLEGLEGFAESESAVRQTCNQIWGLSEQVFRRRLLREFGIEGVELLKDLQRESEVPLNINWRQFFHLLSQDWHFWDVGDIRGPTREQDVEEMSVHQNEISIRTVPKDGIWKRIMNGFYCGPNLFASNVNHLYLTSTVTLFPGKYLITLDINVGNLATLIPIRFTVNPSTDTILTPLRREFPNGDIRGICSSNNFMNERYGDYKNFQICIGSIEVSASGGGGTHDNGMKQVSIGIEEIGVVAVRNVLFNAVFFQRVQSVSEEERDGWVFRDHMVKPPVDTAKEGPRSLYSTLASVKASRACRARESV